jgi:hypothetical protein
VAVSYLALFLSYSYHFFPFFGRAHCSTGIARAAPTDRAVSFGSTSASTGIILVRVSPIVPLLFLFDGAFF